MNEPEEPEGNVIQGLLIAVLLGLLLWCAIIAVYVTWPLMAGAIGITFAAFCFWKAWKAWK
jgi:hypothetical protein